MPDSRLTEISRLQMERAKQILNSVPVIIKVGDYYSAVNRAYYAAFHAIKAVEALENYDSKKLSGLLAHFRKDYIKTGIFPIEFSDILKGLSQYRQDSDYDIFVTITLEEAIEQYNNADEFVCAVEKYISTI